MSGSLGQSYDVEILVGLICRPAGATRVRPAVSASHSQGDDVAPIPGTKRVERVEEDSAADGVALTAERAETLDSLTSAAGDPHGRGAAGHAQRPRPRPTGRTARGPPHWAARDPSAS